VAVVAYVETHHISVQAGGRSLKCSQLCYSW